MAFSKNQKELMIKQYADWIDRSRAVFVLSYSKMRMPAVNAARAKLREVDGQLHVVKNRLFTHVLDEKGYQFDPKFWEGNNVGLSTVASVEFIYGKQYLKPDEEWHSSLLINLDLKE